MRKILIVGCFCALIVAGCSPTVPETVPPDPPTEVPRVAPTAPVETPENPPPCWEADLIYSTRIKQMLLVNCVGDPGKMTLLTIWGWDGARWKKIAQDGPPGRILGG